VLALVRRCAIDGHAWPPAHLTLERFEERRLAAAELLWQGRFSQADITLQLGVSRASILRWAATLTQRGRRGLKARPITGRPPRLDKKAGVRLDRPLKAHGLSVQRPARPRSAMSW
jgi:transposase